MEEAGGGSVGDDNNLIISNSTVLESKLLCRLQVAWKESIHGLVEKAKRSVLGSKKMTVLLPEKDYLFDSIEGFEAEDYSFEGFKADGNSRPCTDVINDCKCLLYFVYMLNV